MLRFVVRRLLLLIPILFGVSVLIFFWVHALPGGPAESLLGERGTPELIQQYRETYGLDEPLPVQFVKYVKTLVVERDLGVSGVSRRPVTTEIREKFPATIELAIMAMVFAVSLGVPLGFIAAKHHGRPGDHTAMLVSLLGVSIPIFFLAIILKYIFAVRLGWLPSVGREDILATREHPTNFYLLDAIIERDWGAFSDSFKHLILPAIALGSIPFAIITRITRASVLDVQNEDYVRTARAKGVSPAIVDRRHVLRNAMLPITTIIGLQTGLLLSGAVLTETVFAYPGMGFWLQQAITNRDYPVLQGGIMFLAVVFVLVNLLVDVSYALMNPRIRYG
ncbi:MAG: ABC transporter permease [Gaiellaceae bacterium]